VVIRKAVREAGELRLHVGGAHEGLGDTIGTGERDVCPEELNVVVIRVRHPAQTDEGLPGNRIDNLGT
jgi:hypothetical protein